MNKISNLKSYTGTGILPARHTSTSTGTNIYWKQDHTLIFLLHRPTSLRKEPVLGPNPAKEKKSEPDMRSAMPRDEMTGLSLGRPLNLEASQLDQTLPASQNAICGHSSSKSRTQWQKTQVSTSRNGTGQEENEQEIVPYLTSICIVLFFLEIKHELYNKNS